jgi:Flp pilus assembly protein TadG
VIEMIRMMQVRGALAREDGVAAVEFALVAIPLFMVVFGIMVFGVVFSQYQAYTSAAREGARVAAVRGSAGEIATAAENAAVGYPLGGTPTANLVCDDSTSGQPVTVSWSQPFEIDIPFVPTITKSVTISGTFRCE